jgi:hypothetical protein
MTNRFFCFPVLCFLLFFGGGCVRFDYAGQRFAPRAESAPVVFFNGQANFPAQEFRIIGRGVLTVSAKSADYDNMGELRERARKYGADGVCIVDNQLVGSRIFPAPEDEFVSPYKANGVPVKNNTWDPKLLKGNSHIGRSKQMPDRAIRVLFLKKAVDLEKELQQKNPLL